jgi:AcrR family transcriptional regulator
MIKSSSPAASRQEPRRLRTRAALLRAGAELLAARPIEAIAVNDIVEIAGVAKGSFFNHFADKGAFAGEIAGEIRARVEEEVTAANVGVADPAQRLARGIAGFVRFALREPSATRIMLSRHDRAPGAEHPLNRGLRNDLALGAASGRLHVPMEEAAMIYVLGVCQMLLNSIVNGGADAGEARRLAAAVVGLALAGLGVADAEAEAVAARAIAEIVVC